MRIPTESLLGRLGGNVGQGLAGGLQHLGQQQAIQQKRSQISDVLKSLNIPEEAAGLPEPILQAYIKQRMANEGRGVVYGADQEQQGSPLGQMFQQQPMQQPMPGQSGQNVQSQQSPLLQLRQQQQLSQPSQPSQQPQQQVPQGVNPKAVMRQIAGKPQQATKLSPEQSQDLEVFKNNKEQINVLKDMYKLWKGGNVPAGRFGRSMEFITGPKSEGQEFENLTKKLVQLRVGVLGNPTDAKLKFLEASKPNLEQNSDVQRKIILKDIKEAQQQAKDAFARLPAWQQEELRRIGQDPGEEIESRRPHEAQRQQQAQEQDNPEDKPESEGWGDWIARNISRAREKTGEILAPSEGFQKWVDHYFPEPVSAKTQKEADIVKGLKEPSKEQPHGFGEEVFDNVLSTLPLLYGPASANIAKSLGSHIASTAASTGVKRQGGGAIPQILAGVATGVGVNKIAGALKNGVQLSKLKDAAQSAQKDAYATESRLGSKIEVAAPKYAEGLRNIENEIGQAVSLDGNSKQELLTKIAELQSDLGGNNKLNAHKLIQRKQQIYGTYEDFNKAGRDYLSRIKNVITDEAERIGKKHPKWNSSWKTGDDIHKALHWKDTLLRKIDANPKIAQAITSKVGYGILGLGSSLAGLALKGPGLVAGTAAGAGAINKLGRVISFAISKNPQVKKLAYDAIRKTMEGTPTEVAKAYARLSKATRKYDGLLEDDDI